jgi:DNA-binding PadR family transcriptional regulator
MMESVMYKVFGGGRGEKKLLAFLYYFDKIGVREVSITEILDAVKIAQERSDLGYRFSEKVFYSSDVFDELDDIERKGYVRRYSYRHDGYFPLNYVALTPTGYRQSEKVLKNISPEELEIIKDSVIKATKNLEERYRLWRRKLPKRKTFSQYQQQSKL